MIKRKRKQKRERKKGRVERWVGYCQQNQRDPQDPFDTSFFFLQPLSLGAFALKRSSRKGEQPFQDAYEEQGHRNYE